MLHWVLIHYVVRNWQKETFGSYYQRPHTVHLWMLGLNGVFVQTTQSHLHAQDNSLLLLSWRAMSILINCMSILSNTHWIFWTKHHSKMGQVVTGADSWGWSRFIADYTAIFRPGIPVLVMHFTGTSLTTKVLCTLTFWDGKIHNAVSQNPVQRIVK